MNSIDLTLSIVKTQAILFNRLRNIRLPDFIELNQIPVPLLFSVKYLGVTMDSGLRWTNHLKHIKENTIQYQNVLKWISGPAWGVNPSISCYFINATIVAQILWRAFWFSSASRSYLSKLNNKVGSLYKIALGLPPTLSNRIAWVISSQKSLSFRISKLCDRFICKLIQLGHRNIRNKIDQVHRMSLSRKIAKRRRWENASRFWRKLFK